MSVHACTQTGTHIYECYRAADISYKYGLEFLKLNFSTVFLNLQVKIYDAQNNFKLCLMPLQTLQIAL